MDRDKQKKIDERAILNQYLEYCPIVGAIEARERPDFQIITCNGVVGIEVTRYDRPKEMGEKFKLREFEATLHDLLSSELVAREGKPGLAHKKVRINFRKREIPPKRRWGHFFQAAHNLIALLPLENDGLWTKIKMGDDHPRILKDFLSSMEVRRAQFIITWGHNFDVMGIGESGEELKASLTEKLTNRFSDQFDELRLIVAGDGVSFAENVGILRLKQLDKFHQLNSAILESQYDQVAIFDFEGVWIKQKDNDWFQITKSQT